jgi:diguanylate cyclase (GGDEF)-like protein
LDKVGQLFRNWVAPSKSIVVFCTLLLLITWGGALLHADWDRRTSIEKVWEDNNKYALAFEEHVRRVLKTNEQYLVLLKNEYERRGNTAALQDILRQIAADSLITQTSILNVHGRPVVSALPVDPQASFADLPHFYSHRHEDASKLYIGKAALGRVSHKYTIQLSRRINQPDGSFGGIATIAMSPLYFSRFYNDMKFNENYVVRLTGLDKIVRASNDEKEINVDISNAVLWQKITESSSGFYYSRGVNFNIPRFHSYRVMPDYPLVVQVGIAEAALTPMVHRIQVYYAVAALVSLFILFFTGRLLIAARKQRCSELDLQQSVRELTESHGKLERSQRTADFLRQHDSLTGVFNRAYFENDMARKNAGEHETFGIFVCDVDGLKLINDTLGHRQGDELLKVIADLLHGGIAAPSYVARIGGDELAVVIENGTPAVMKKLEEVYRAKIAEHNQNCPQLPLSVSMGWAVGETVEDTDILFKTADNNMYRQKMHQSQSVRGSIVKTMMVALEAKDHITEGHADRLGDLMEQMGRALQLPQAVVADMRLLAKFHDIGKVGIPDSILKKPGKLTQAEMVIMRQHCEIGYRIAKSSPDLEPIADCILKHQEHWDGNGYPLGISGEQIPIECRVLGIVDAFDAMTNDRPYRQAMTEDEAIKELLRCAGAQFDATLVEVFIALHTEMKSSR